MGTYITIASVRRTSGVSESQIDDTDVEAAITEVEKEVPRKFNTVFAPTENIEIIDGDGTNRARVGLNPLLSVRALDIDSETEDPANLLIYKESGYIFLTEDAEITTFKNKRQSVVVKYLYGSLINSTTSSTSSADEVAGTSVSIALASITGFADADWVEIYGIDGNRETAQISGVPGAGVIVVDQLVQTHESGSTVVKLEIDTNFTKLMNIITGISLVARVLGESASDIVGYEIAEFRVQKGEPYTQWRETAIQLIKERDELYKTLSIRPSVL